MAIMLKDIIIMDLINYAESRSKLSIAYENIYNWLLQNEIKDYQQLKDLFDIKNYELNLEATIILYEHLQKVIAKVEKANQLGNEPKIFTFNNYEYLGLDSETLRITDNSNRGGILLCSSPINNSGNTLKNRLNNFTITEIKYLLSHLKENDLKNGLTIIKNLSLMQCPKIVKLVDFYNQQVLRQYFETNQTGIDLFGVNREEKREIVIKNLEQIIKYIVDNASDECIWGSLGITQKNRITYVSKSTKYSGDTDIIRESLVDIFTKYTTLTELKNGIYNEQEIIVVENNVKTLRKGIPANRFLTLK